MAGSKKKAADEADGAGEAWLRSADGERAVRLRTLNSFLEKGGAVTEARIVQDAEGLWTIRLRLTGRPGEVVVNRFESDTPRAYKDVALAINTIYADMGYRGAIIISTERDYSSNP